MDPHESSSQVRLRYFGILQAKYFQGESGREAEPVGSQSPRCPGLQMYEPLEVAPPAHATHFSLVDKPLSALTRLVLIYLVISKARWQYAVFHLVGPDTERPSTSVVSPIVSSRSASASRLANCETASVILGSIKLSSGIVGIAVSSCSSRSST